MTTVTVRHRRLTSLTVRHVLDCAVHRMVILYNSSYVRCLACLNYNSKVPNARKITYDALNLE